MRVMPTPIPYAFELSEGEKTHPLWARLHLHFTVMLEQARVRNDGLKLSEVETAALRGRISTLKELVRLGEDKPIIQTE